MKRLVWILAIVWCTAFAQVQPVAVAPDASDQCCADKCACQPDCRPAACAVLPAPGASSLVAETPGLEARRTEDGSATSPAVSAQAFYLSLVPPSAPRPVVPGRVALASAAVPPLFKAHCSYLL